MKTLAEVKSSLSKAVKPAIKDEDGEILVPERPVDIEAGYIFYAIEIKQLADDVPPLDALFRQLNLPPADFLKIHLELKEGETPPHIELPNYTEGMFAVADEEYVYVAARKELPIGIKMV